MSRILAATLALLVTPPAAGAQPSARANASGCLPPARAEQLLREVRRLVSASDSASRFQRELAGLPWLRPEAVVLEQNAARCQMLVRAFNETGYEFGPARQVAAVRVGGWWAVEGDSTAGRRGCCWGVWLIDARGRSPYGYGAGL